MSASDIRSCFVLLRYVVFCGRQRYALRPQKELNVEDTMWHSTIVRPDDASVAVLVKKCKVQRYRPSPSAVCHTVPTLTFCCMPHCTDPRLLLYATLYRPSPSAVCHTVPTLALCCMPHCTDPHLLLYATPYRPSPSAVCHTVPTLAFCCMPHCTDPRLLLYATVYSAR
jgi:hypothetical protein